MTRTGAFVFSLFALGLTAGAAYSFDQVRFGDRAVMFFRAVLAGEEGFRDFRGRGDADRRRPTSVADSVAPGESGLDSLRLRPFAGDSARRRPFPGDSAGWSVGERRESRRRRPPGDAESREIRAGREESGGGFRGRGRGRGSAVSLEEVGHYTVIMMFVTMLTVVTEGLVKRVARAHRRGRPAV